MYGILDIAKFYFFMFVWLLYKKAACINVTLRYSPLKTASEKLNKKKALLNY